MVIEGGATSGYCETGIFGMANKPASVMASATTQAKIGRSMKNCGMCARYKSMDFAGRPRPAETVLAAQRTMLMNLLRGPDPQPRRRRPAGRRLARPGPAAPPPGRRLAPPGPAGRRPADQAA